MWQFRCTQLFKFIPNEFVVKNTRLGTFSTLEGNPVLFSTPIKILVFPDYKIIKINSFIMRMRRAFCSIATEKGAEE